MKTFYKNFLTVLIAAFVLATPASGYRDWEGSLTPYPEITARAEYPDSLRPVFVNHVGRHGSRYPASDTHCRNLQKALQRAARLGTITPLGESLAALTDEIIRLSEGRWGALDSLGRAEQTGIGRRLCQNYPEVFSDGCEVKALSSHSPRSIESMEACIEGLTSCKPTISCKLYSGQDYDPLVRPFDYFKYYSEYLKGKLWQPPYTEYFDLTAPTPPICRALGENYPFKDEAEARELALTEYYVLAGCSAMMMPNPMAGYFTSEEARALWSCFNLRQYLQRSASEISAVPADIAAPLLEDLISLIDCFITDNTDAPTNTHGTPGSPGSPDTPGSLSSPRAILRFGHGETILPLVALMRLPGCYYLTDDYATVSYHWQDYRIIPMAANLQMILFQAKASDRYYCQILLNESPIRLHPDDPASIYPWPQLRQYLLSALSSSPLPGSNFSR